MWTNKYKTTFDFQYLHMTLLSTNKHAIDENPLAAMCSSLNFNSYILFSKTFNNVFKIALIYFLIMVTQVSRETKIPALYFCFVLE